jgi:hypothetical protein
MTGPLLLCLGDEHNLLGIATYHTTKRVTGSITEPTGPKSLCERTTLRIDPIGPSPRLDPISKPRVYYPQPCVAQRIPAGRQHLFRSKRPFVAGQHFDAVRDHDPDAFGVYSSKDA